MFIVFGAMMLYSAAKPKPVLEPILKAIEAPEGESKGG